MKMATRDFAAVAATVMCTAVGAAPLKIAMIDPLTGPLAATGKIYEVTVRYAVDRLNQAGGFNGQPIELVILDDAGNSSVTSDRFREAAAQGAHIMLKSLTSATAAQLSEDVRRHNLRNPQAAVLFINQGAEASDLTGAKCHFHSFRFATTASMRAKALLSTMKDQDVLKEGVYAINQNYSLGQEMEAATKAYSQVYGYKVVGSALHDFARIQDFTPYANRIRETGASAVITSSYGSDLLLLAKAASESGLKSKFGTIYLDQPGNLASGGAAMEGSYNAAPYNMEIDPTNLPADFKAKVGVLPSYHVQGHVVAVLSFLHEALKTVSKGKDDKVDVNAIALAVEKARFKGPVGELSVRAADHQMVLPVVVSKVSTKVKYPLDNTKFGFEVVKTIPGSEAIYPVQDSCKMVRP